jgi:hypothetical protein
MKRQHALGWEKNVFSRPRSIPYISSSSFMGKCKVFFRFLLIPSRYSRDILLVEDKDQTSPICCIPIQGWIGQAYEDASFHDLIPPSHVHDLNSMIECSIMFVSDHDHFLLDFSLMWFIIRHKGGHFDKMLGWLCWLYAIFVDNISLIISSLHLKISYEYWIKKVILQA